jgi:hypothetical protein
MKMSEGITTCKSKVETLLSNYPQLRDSDKLLWLAYLNKFHNLNQIIGQASYELLKSLLMNENTPTMESVRRVRQKLQEEGKYQGTMRKNRMSEQSSVIRALK